MLNHDQMEIAKRFFSFLFDDTQHEMIISGFGGSGKSYLISTLLKQGFEKYKKLCVLNNVSPKYWGFFITATTNKAAEVLSRNIGETVPTIHSFLNLVIKNNYLTGDTDLYRNEQNWYIHTNEVIFIDECSMINRALYEEILGSTKDCKIVYVGDHNQLAPVKERLSPIYLKNLPEHKLIKPVRNVNQPKLFQVCEHLRECVEHGTPCEIPRHEGVIEVLDDASMQRKIREIFMEQGPSCRILGYTNKQVIAYNDYIRNMRGITEPYVAGEYLVAASSMLVRNVDPYVQISPEDGVWIESLKGPMNIPIKESSGVTIQCYVANLNLSYYSGSVPAYLPIDKMHYRALQKHFAKYKLWTPYFYLKDKFLDLRLADSCTVHKSQGSTYDSVIIDLSDLSTCTQKDMVARLLYVAFTRATTKVYLYGNLKERYGRIV